MSSFDKKLTGSAAWLGCGSSFYPEHHPEELWDSYLEQMVEAGVRFLRVFEFSWGALEPQMGRYEFEWADRFLDKLDQVGISYIVGTPSAAAPKWFKKKFPESAVKGPFTQGYTFRRNQCPSHREYRTQVDRLIEMMTKRWGKRKGLLAWQVDNELGHPECHCEGCESRFRGWLKERYKTPEALNQKCVLAMWSHQIQDWDELVIPMNDNPALRMLFRQWNSEKWLEFGESSRREIQRNSDRPVFVNMMNPWHGYDHFEMAKKMNFVAFDYYPIDSRLPIYSDNDVDFSMAYMRSIALHQPFWMTEVQAGGGARLTPPPGMIREWSLKMIAHGANALGYFRWDTPHFGGEELEYGVVGPGLYRDRIYDEVKRTIQEVGALDSAIAESIPEKGEVAIYFNFQSWWKDLDWHEGIKASDPKDLVQNYILLLKNHFLALSAMGYRVDLCHSESDLRSYSLIVVPQLLSVSDPEAMILEKWVIGGGILLLAAPGFTHDHDGGGYCAPYPGVDRLRKMTGVRHGSGGRLIPGFELQMEIDQKKIGKVSQWAEQMEIEGEEVIVLGKYTTGTFYSDYPALTMNRYVKGKVLYLGCVLEDYEDLYRRIQREFALEGGEQSNSWWIRKRICSKGREIVFQKNRTEKNLVYEFQEKSEKGLKDRKIDFLPNELKVYYRSSSEDS